MLTSASTWGLDKPGPFTGQIIHAGGVRWQLGPIVAEHHATFSRYEYRATPIEGARTGVDETGKRRKITGRDFTAYRHTEYTGLFWEVEPEDCLDSWAFTGSEMEAL